MAREIPGSGAVIKPIFNEIFGVRAVKVVNGGEGYVSSDPPRLTVTGCGVPDEEALLYPIIDDDSGRITHVRVLNPGRGYDPLRINIIPEQDTPNVLTSFDINRIWQTNPNSSTTGVFQQSGNRITDRLLIESDNHPKPADYPGERDPGGGIINDRSFSQTFIYRGGKETPNLEEREFNYNKSIGILANGGLLHTPNWGVIGEAPTGFFLDTVKYNTIKNQDQFDGVIENNNYYYQSSRLINQFSQRNGVFENGFLKPFVWDIIVETDNIMIPVSTTNELLGRIEVGRFVEVIGGNSRAEIAKVIRNQNDIVERIYLRLVNGTFEEGDRLIGSNGFTTIISDDPITFPNGIFYINFKDQAAEFGNFAPNTYYLAPQNIQVQRNYLIIWNQVDASNQPNEIHAFGHPMQFSTTPDGPLNQNPGTLYYNSNGASAAPAADYENEFKPLFIMNGDETNRIYYYCKYHNHMSGYIGDEGYMTLSPIVDNETPLNDYYITNFYSDGSSVDYSRHSDGHSKILGVSFDGYPIYGPWGYDSTKTAVRLTSSYRLRTGAEVEGSRPRLTTPGNVSYSVTISGGEYKIDGTSVSFLTLDRGKTYTFDLTDSSNDGNQLLFSTTEDGWHGDLLGNIEFLYEKGVSYYIDNSEVEYSEYISNFNSASQRSIVITPTPDSPRLAYIFGYNTQNLGFRVVQEGYLLGDFIQDYIYDDQVGGSSLDPEYNNGPIINVSGNGSDFFKREVTTNGVRIMGAGTVGGQTAVPDAWLEKVGRMFELFTDVNGAGINETLQRNLIKTLSGDAGTWHEGLPTLQRVARGAGADYTPNFLTDQGVVDWNLTPLFDTHVANDMVWYLNSTGDGYGDGDTDAQEVIEHVFHTLHMHGLPADDIKLYQFLAADWQTGDLYAAMEEAYDAGKWDPSGYQANPDDWKTIADAFEVAAKEYLYLLNFCMFEYTDLWDGNSLAPEWSDDMRTQAGIQANNPLGYAFHNTYIAPVISKPSLATIRSIFQDGNTPAQDNPALAGASGYVVDIASASGESLDEFNGKFAVTPEYPNGTYAYFLIEDVNSDPVYPYSIAPQYFGASIFEGDEVDEASIEFPSGAEAEVVLDDNTGSVSYIKMTKNGDGYFGPAQAKILGGEGTGAVASPIVQTVTGLTLLNPGRNFATPPTLVFEGGGGQDVQGVARISTTGKLSSIDIVNPGQFYTDPPFILITGGGGIGAKAQARINQGEIVGIDIIEPGNGYTTPPNIIFTKLVNLKRKISNRQSYNSSSFFVTGLTKSVTSSDDTIYVSSTDAFPGSGSLILNDEIINYASKSRERFSGLTRGVNFNYDQRVVLDSTQDDDDGISSYKFSIGDRIIRRIEDSTSKVAKVYDWDPATKELLVVFEVDELAFIDAGIPTTEDTIVQFDAGIADSSNSIQFPHVVIDAQGESIVTLTSPIGELANKTFEDDDELDGAGDGIPDLVNTGTAFANQISLDGGIYSSLYGIEETIGGQNTTLFEIGDQVKDASLPFKYATISSAGNLNEGQPHDPLIDIYIDGNYGNGQDFFLGEIVTGSASNISATVESWNNTTGVLTIKDIVPHNTGNVNVGLNGYLYKFSDKGTIVDFIIQDAGADYTATPTLGIENSGDIQTTATAVMTVSGDQISSVTITEGGYGYIQTVDGSYQVHPTVTIVNDPADTTGSGAVLQAVLGGENIVGNNGASYRIKKIEYRTQMRSE